MPLYEYQCTVCDHSFEERQSFDSEPICACPQCQNSARRLFKPAPIIFKGSGFYVTDYNSKGPVASSEKPESSTETVTKPESTAPVTAEKPTEASAAA